MSQPNDIPRCDRWCLKGLKDLALTRRIKTARKIGVRIKELGRHNLKDALKWYLIVLGYSYRHTGLILNVSEGTVRKLFKLIGVRKPRQRKGPETRLTAV